jgi:hypothetical protein
MAQLSVHCKTLPGEGRGIAVDLVTGSAVAEIMSGKGSQLAARDIVQACTTIASQNA